MRTGYDPLWTVGRRVLARQWQPFLLMLAPLAIAYVAVTVAAVRGDTSVAVAAAVFAAATGVFGALSETPPGEVSAITAAHAYAELRQKLDDGVRRTPEDVEGAGTASAVRFEDVSFTYPGTDRLVLHHLDLEIRPGELLAHRRPQRRRQVHADQAAGRALRPTAGRITADGVDMATLGRRLAGPDLGGVPGLRPLPPDRRATTSRWATRPCRATAAALEAAARDAGLDDGRSTGCRTAGTRRWPATRTGGVDLSGGQWQQVVLARALYAVRTGARLLVLDEPTAHLDVRTEFDVFGRLAAQPRRRQRRAHLAPALHGAPGRPHRAARAAAGSPRPAPTTS